MTLSLFKNVPHYYNFTLEVNVPLTVGVIMQLKVGNDGLLLSKDLVRYKAYPEPGYFDIVEKLYNGRKGVYKRSIHIKSK